MVLIGGGGSPLSTTAVSDTQKERRRITGAPMPRRRPRTRFGQKFETRGNKERWQQRLDQVRQRREAQQRLLKQQLTVEKTRKASIRELSERLADQEKKSEARRRFQEVEQRQAPSFKQAKKRRPQKGPGVFDAFKEGGVRETAQKTLDKLPPSLRALVSMALQKDGMIPGSAFGEKLRARLQQVQGGSLTDLTDLVNDSESLDEITEVGKNVLAVHSKNQNIKRQLFNQRITSEFAPVDNATRLDREQVIVQPSETKNNLRANRLLQRERGIRAASLGVSVEEYNKLTPDRRLEMASAEGGNLTSILEKTRTRDEQEANTSAEMLEKHGTFIQKIKDEQYPNRQDEVEVAWNDAADQLMFRLPKGPWVGVAVPAKIVEQLHGTDMAEDFALRGFSVLPEDSPLHRPSLSDVGLRLLSSTAELVASPLIDKDPKPDDKEELVYESTLVEAGDRLTTKLVADFIKENPDAPRLDVTRGARDYVNEFIKEEKAKLLKDGLSEDAADIQLVASLRMGELLEEELKKSGGNEDELRPHLGEQLTAQEIASRRLLAELGPIMDAIREKEKPSGGVLRGVGGALGDFAKAVPGVLKLTTGFDLGSIGDIEEVVNSAARINGLLGIITGESLFEPKEEATSEGLGQVDVLKGEGGVLRGLDALEEIRQSGKSNIVEPLLPDFEFKLPVEKIAKFMPELQMADLAIKTIQRDLGNEEPTGLPQTLTIDDDMVAELLSYAVDPLLLFPGIGFGGTIAKISGKVGRNVAIKLARDPRFMRALGDRLFLVRAEAGFIRSGGQEAQMIARLQVLDDIAKGVETTDDIFKPARQAMDNLVDNAVADSPVGRVPEVTELAEDASGRVTMYRGVTSSDADKLGNLLDEARHLTHDKRLAEGYANRRLLPGDTPVVLEIQVPKSTLRKFKEIYFTNLEPAEIVSKTQARTIKELRAIEETGEKSLLVRRLIDDAKSTLDDLGEGGGGRLRKLERGDRVRIREGQFSGQTGRVTATLKKRRFDVELEGGRVVRVKDRVLDPVDVLEEAEELRRAGQLADRTRGDQVKTLRDSLEGAGPKARKAITAQIDEIEEQARLAEFFKDATAPGGELAERATQVDELKKLRDRLLKAKGEGRKGAIKKRILALEEALGIEEDASTKAIRQAGVDILQEAKEAHLASQSETINGLVRRQREIDLQLFKRKDLLSPEELVELEARKNQVTEELVRIRSEADEAVESLTLSQRALLEGDISPATLTLEQIERFAFSRTSPVGQLVKKVSAIPAIGRIFRFPANLLDASLFHADNFIGRKWVAYQRLLESLEASSTTAAHAMRAKKVPFEQTKAGIEQVTGRPLFDVIEDWDNVRHLFTDEQDDFVKLLDRVRLEALRDMSRLGVEVPDAWFEVTHVFRNAIAKDGIDMRSFFRGSSRSKPGSLRQRSYEVMKSGVDNGVEYEKDIIAVYIDAISSMREFAARRAFMDSIKWKRGVPLKLLVNQEARLVVSLAAREYSWAKVAQRYVHQSVRGRPPKPGLRASKNFQVDVPDDVTDVVERVAELNRVSPGKKTPAQLAEVRALRTTIDSITTRNSGRLRGFRTELKKARENVNTSVQREGGRFGRPGEVVEISGAPIGDFPELSGRLYLAEDIDVLKKIARNPKNPFFEFTSKVTGVMRTPQTAFDPGFWFIQGLGALGLDAGRFALALPTGKLAELGAFPGGPTSIWRRSMWRSIVGLTSERKAAEFWAEQASKHPQQWERFIQHGRVISHQDTYSTEVLQEVLRGGFFAKLDRKIPFHPLERVGNAFTNFMNAASWESWKALEPLAKNVDNLEELGAFVRSLSGRNSLRGLGISHTQQLIERTLWYAPSYTRATAAIMMKAALDPLSFGGRQALKSMAGLAMSMTFLFGAVSLGEQLAANGGDITKIDWDDLIDDVKKAWDPTSSKFMTKRIGNSRFGLGGNMRSTINFMGKMIAAGYNDPKSLQPWDMNNRFFVNFNHPIMRFVRGKSSPLIGTAWDVLSGKDFLGYAVDKPIDIAKLPLQLAPFAVQAMLEQTGLNGNERAGVGASEWFGLRTFPVGEYQLYQEEAERSLNDKWENLQGTDFLKQAERDKENFPELWKAKKAVDDQQRARGDEFQKLQELAEGGKKEKESELLPLALEIDWGRPDGGELFSGQYKNISAKHSDNYDVGAKALGIDLSELDDQEFPNKDAELEAKLIKLDPLDFRNPEGTKIDWDAFNEERDGILSQMTPRNRQAAENKKFNVADPRLEETLRRRAGAIEALQPYFDAPKYKGLNKKEEEQVDSLITVLDEVRGMLSLRGKNVSRATLLTFMAKAGVGEPKIVATAFVLSKSNISHLVKSTFKRDWVFEHPDMVTFYGFTFFDLDEEDQELWLEKFSLRSSIGIRSQAPLLEDEE